MSDQQTTTPLGRRALVARFAAVALSWVGLSAFRRIAPMDGMLTSARSAPIWDDKFELVVDLELATQSGARTHRPYVAIWVEDAAGRSIRTLSLWVSTVGRGPRYIRELRQWFSMAQSEQSAGGPDLVATVSSATRLPGQYSVVWNGRDDRGKPVEQGTYRVIIEASREHGTYQLMKHELTLGATPVAFDWSANQEIGRAHVEYRRRK